MGLRVLVVDDELINQLILQQQLLLLGCEAETASDGDEAASRAAGFDLVLMDLHMPACDGIEATRRIRASGHPVRIVGVTASADHDGPAALEAGMNACIQKPVTPEVLSGLIG